MTMSIAPADLHAAHCGDTRAGEPHRDCPLCPRLVSFRHANRVKYPEWFNAPVPSFGPPDAPLLIVGLAPGLRGANRTGRPFTGDYAGVLLYETLLQFGFASGSYGECPDDGLVLKGCRITNAVRCVPPENKPLPDEIAACNGFLSASIAGTENVRAILALGKIAFDAVLRALGFKLSRCKFAHGAAFDLGDGCKLFGSYHCSRYNTNTGRLTPAMFHRVFEDVAAHLRAAGNAGHPARVD
jgi:uracil-DNA glycosylase family 4